MMSNEDREDIHNEIKYILAQLRNCLTESNYGIAFDAKGKNLLFFDTDVYLNEHRYDGIGIKMDDLVN